MTDSIAPLSPLVGDGSPLNVEDQGLIARLNDDEATLIAGLPTDDPKDPKRQRRVGLTLPEIADQPLCIKKTVTQQRDVIGEVGKAIADAGIKRIIMTGCGDSLACHVAVRALLEEMTGVPCEPVQALELAYYQHRFIDQQTLVIGLSSSGSTPRTVEALLLAHERGAKVLAMSNTPGSPIMDVATFPLMIEAERKGWPTQSSTAAIALMAQLALDIGRARGVNLARVEGLQAQLDAVPEMISTVLQSLSGPVETLARDLSGAPMVLFSGAGPSYASAMFGAAKIKECTSGHALAIPLEEFHHYTSIKPGESLMLIAPPGPLQARALDTARRAKVWRGRVFGVLEQDDTTIGPNCEAVFAMPAIAEELSSLIYSLPVQVLAVHMALQEFEKAAGHG